MFKKTKIKITTASLIIAIFAFAAADLYGQYNATGAPEINFRAGTAAEEAKIAEEINYEELAKRRAEAKRPIPHTYTVMINFKTDSCFLTVQCKRDIRDLVNALKNYDYNMITLRGHSDNVEAEKWNGELSKQRAIIVYGEFMKAGADKAKLHYCAFADAMPVNSNETEEGRAENRRTEIFVE